MKNLLTFFVSILFSPCLGILQAACPTGDITLTSQAAIDNFPTLYSGCTVMPYNITISEAVMGNIVNLNGLSALTEIQGSLIIGGNEALDDLTGLNAIVAIGGDLIIEDNAGLTTLNGLESVATVSYGISIGSNTSLTTISALSNVTGAIEGPISIGFNDALANLTGLAGISEVLSYVRITHNNSLANIVGLDGLTSIGDYLQIEYNPALTGISGMNALSTIGSSIDINDNFHLSTISGFSTLSSISGRLYIYLNHDLTSISGFTSLASLDGSLEIRVNVSLLSITGLSSLTNILGDLIIVGNIHLTSMSSLSALLSVGNRASIAGNDDLLDLSGLNGLSTIGEDLEIIGNDELASLNGLSGLTIIGRNLIIRSNFILNDLTALSGLSTINGGSLAIQFNENLTSLNGLGNIAPGSISDLTITNCYLLSQCEVQSICVYLSNPGNPANISGNATGCAYRTEVEMACALILPVELAQFNGKQDVKGISLFWQTSSERNNHYFEVEKSDDGWHWLEVGKVAGMGTTSTGASYKLLDEQPFKGTNYYRLRQVDFDGKEQYSQVVSIDFHSLHDFGNLKLSPNPATAQIQLVNVETTGYDCLRIFNMNGRPMLQTYDLGSPINIEQMKDGMYYVQLTGSMPSQVQHFIKSGGKL